jgi:hypothetical protein
VDRHRIFFFISPEHVPAPQLASPAGAAFVPPDFLGPALAGAFAVVVDAPVAAGVAVAFDGAVAVGSDAAGVVAAGDAPGGALGLGVAAGVSDFGAVALLEQALAEQEACPAAVEVEGATSFAWTGGGVAPPHWMAALAPSAASTAVNFSNDKSGRMRGVLPEIVARWFRELG